MLASPVPSGDLEVGGGLFRWRKVRARTRQASQVSSVLVIPLMLVATTAASPQLIAPGQGEQLMRFVEAYGMAGLDNADELTFHLCDLALGRIEDPAQKQQLRGVCEDLGALRTERDQRVKGAIAASDRPDALRASYAAAIRLHRLAAGQIVRNLLNPGFDGERYSFVDLDTLGETLEDIGSTRIEGYGLEMKEIIPGVEMQIEARPRESDGDFLCLSFANGFALLRGGGAGVSDCFDSGTQRLELRNWATPRPEMSRSKE